MIMDKKRYIAPAQTNRSLVIGRLMLGINEGSPDPDTGVLTKDRHNDSGEDFTTYEDDGYGNLW